jgi:excinuclease ABC subunit C
MINHATDLDFIVTKNENESLILESNMINKYQPKYNILLKERYNYPYIALTNDQHPRIIYTRNPKIPHAKYFGPFASSSFNSYEIYKLLLRVFPLRKCKHVGKVKCLYYDIGQCVGPCVKQIAQGTYEVIKQQINEFFAGKTHNIIASLEAKEHTASTNLQFELARECHELIENIKNINKHVQPYVLLKNNKKIDVIGYIIEDGYLAIIIHTYINGKLLAINKQIEELFDEPEELIVSYLLQHYLQNQTTPSTIYVQLSTEHLTELAQALQIEVINPIHGKYKEIIKNAVTNAQDYYKSDFLVAQNIHKNQQQAFEDLHELLKTNNLNLIHVFDMANLFNTERVGCMIGIENGVFNKKLYRKFIIKNQASNSDVEYMHEVISRQYQQVINKKEALPNLIIVDGATNQINSAVAALKTLKLDKLIPVIGLAKNIHHKTESIVLSDKSKIMLDPKSHIYMYLFNIQEEVHRFTITFFRQRKNKVK